MPFADAASGMRSKITYNNNRPINININSSFM